MNFDPLWVQPITVDHSLNWKIQEKLLVVFVVVFVSF